MFLHWDPMYFVFLAPGMLLALWAQAKVKWAYASASQIPSRSGYTGAMAAQQVMQAGGVFDVQIEQTDGFLSDHYDPRHRVLRLSPDVYSGRSLAALGIGAHEAGHAIQPAHQYTLLTLRNAIVPLASIGGNLSMFVILAGALLSMFNLIVVGIALFSLTVIFQLVNLPVEFNASSRAREALLATGLVDAEEDRTVK